MDRGERCQSTSFGASGEGWFLRRALPRRASGEAAGGARWDGGFEEVGEGRQRGGRDTCEGALAGLWGDVVDEGGINAMPEDVHGAGAEDVGGQVDLDGLAWLTCSTPTP